MQCFLICAKTSSSSQGIPKETVETHTAAGQFAVTGTQWRGEWKDRAGRRTWWEEQDSASAGLPLRLLRCPTLSRAPEHHSPTRILSSPWCRAHRRRGAYIALDGCWLRNSTLWVLLFSTGKRHICRNVCSQWGKFTWNSNMHILYGPVTINLQVNCRFDLCCILLCCLHERKELWGLLTF